jgi:outer membrane receptor protein involved in Fe transport
MFLLLCLLALHTGPVWSADSENSGDSIELDDMDLDSTRPMEFVQVTATRREESIFDVSEGVTVVDSERITEMAPQVITEMLRNEPGAFFQQTTPGQGIPIVRGLKGSQVLHLVDGMRLNNAFFRDAPNQYIGLVDPFNVDRVELVRGSSPTLYGADAMGGVVQFLTPEPRFDGSDWQSSGRFYGSYSSADDSIVGRVQAAAGFDGRSISAGATWRDHGNRRVGGGETIRPSGYEVKGGDFKWIENTDHGEITLSAQLLEQPSTPRVDELVPGYGLQTPSSEQYEFIPNRRSFIHARYRNDTQLSWLSSIAIDLARQVVIDDRITQDYGSPLVTDEDNKSTLDGLTAQFYTELPLASGWSGITWGAEYYTDTVDSSRMVTDLSSNTTRTARGRFPDNSTMDSAAVYASIGWRGESFRMHGGLRYSSFDIFLPGSGEVPSADLSPTDLTGDLHMEWGLSERVNFVANVGRGFRPPNIFDLGTLGPRPGNRFNIPNPNLEPESVWSYDLGFKTRGATWQAEFFLFYMDYEDKIGSRLTGEVTDSGRDVVQSDNINSAELYGLESGIRGYPDENFEVYAVLNYVRGDETSIEGATVPADRVPPLNGKLGMVWQMRDELQVESWIGFTADQDRLSPRDVRDPRINPTGTPGWGTFNILASYQPSEALHLGLRLENLGDNNYREHGSGIDAPGRNIGVWLNYLFN